ncbi:Conserved_hypothetical protein [Hexamita inflata]|uniref:Myb-like DNA-binding domain-containing protein n=1 Tax=Hexamita inflata TaxID=28002 RepID=A0AA86NMJ2_9EUKA|nr:Conserved hypothetical protein [Hexamita inflata]
MTQPHVFTDRELELIAYSAHVLNKDWKKIQQQFLPYLNPISIKNKYYKLLKQGHLQKLMDTKVQKSVQLTPPSIVNFIDDEDEKVIESLYLLAVQTK